MPKDLNGKPAIHSTTVYKVFAKWTDDGSLWQAFVASVAHLAAEKHLDLSVLRGDGTNMVAKKRVMGLAIWATKRCRNGVEHGGEDSPNSYRLMNSPITRACLRLRLGKAQRAANASLEPGSAHGHVLRSMSWAPCPPEAARGSRGLRGAGSPARRGPLRKAPGRHPRWASPAHRRLLAAHHSRAALLRVRLQGVPQPTRWRCLRARRPHLVERCGASTPSLPCLRTAPLHGAVLGVHRLESRMVSRGGQRPLCVCGHDGVRTHVQYACGVAHRPGIPRQGDALLLHRGRVPSLTRGQEERATGTASLAAAVSLRPLTGVARADHIRAGPVGTVEGLENHDATRSPWGDSASDLHRQ